MITEKDKDDLKTILANTRSSISIIEGLDLRKTSSGKHLGLFTQAVMLQQTIEGLLED